jgi:DNA-binding transcriptional ArsR family regulator
MAKATIKPELRIERMDQAAVLLKPLRMEILTALGEPRSCPELAEALGMTMQRAYYHVKVLEKAGLVQRVGERQARGALEGIYQATAQSYWLAPGIVQQLGGRRSARRQASLGVIQRMGEDLLEDVAKLSRQSGEATAAAISARVELRGSARAAFLVELQSAVQTLAEKYGVTGEAGEPVEALKLLLACYAEPDTNQQ